MKPWLIWLILGIISVLFGVIALGNAFAASVAVTLLTGSLFLISGVFQIAAGFREQKRANKLFAVLVGLLGLFVGISLLLHPLEGMISLTLLVALLLAAAGVARLVFAYRMRETSFFWPMLISGALAVLLAGYIFANFGMATMSLLGLLVGVELLLNGGALIVWAFYLRMASRG